MTPVTSAEVCADLVDKNWTSSVETFVFLRESGAGPKSADNLVPQVVFPVKGQSPCSRVVCHLGNTHLRPSGCG